jgi:hypothetical protein
LGSTARKYKLSHANVIFGNCEEENENDDQILQTVSEVSDLRDKKGKEGREADERILRMCKLRWKL